MARAQVLRGKPAFFDSIDLSGLRRLPAGRAAFRNAVEVYAKQEQPTAASERGRLSPADFSAVYPRAMDRMMNNHSATRSCTSRAINTSRANDGIGVGCENRHRQANHEQRDCTFHVASPGDTCVRHAI